MTEADLIGRGRKSGAAVYTVPEIANLLGVNKNSVYAAASSGVIPCLRIGRRFVFPRVAVDQWLRTAAGRVADAA